MADRFTNTSVEKCKPETILHGYILIRLRFKKKRAGHEHAQPKKRKAEVDTAFEEFIQRYAPNSEAPTAGAKFWARKTQETPPRDQVGNGEYEVFNACPLDTLRKIGYNKGLFGVSRVKRTLAAGDWEEQDGCALVCLTELKKRQRTK